MANSTTNEHRETVTAVGAPGSLARFKAEYPALYEQFTGLLKAWERWEADIIEDPRCWAPDGMADTPTLQQEHLDALTDLENRRNRLTELEK